MVHGHNNIDEGVFDLEMVYLAEALILNRSLKRLHLECECLAAHLPCIDKSIDAALSFGAHGAHALGEAMRYNETLTVLSLDGRCCCSLCT